MKKVLSIFTFVFIMFFVIPFRVNAGASKITLYEVNVDITNDGIANVLEHVKLSEKTNLEFKNNYLNSNGLNSLIYVGMDNDFYGSDIYQFKINNQVVIKDTLGNQVGFETLKTSIGEKYLLSDVDEFYISYSLSDVVVEHPDYSEFYYNFFRDKFDLTIEKASVTINLPKQSGYLKTTDYTFSNNSEIKGNKTITYKYSYGVMDKNIRIVFDKGIVTSTKIVDKRISEFVENDINNGFIDKIKYYICIGLTILFYLNFIRLVILIIIKYGSNRKYHTTPTLDETLLKRYNYAGINYLINKDVTVEAFLSGILDLINSGKLNVIKENNEFYLTRGTSSAITVEEEYLINFLLEVIDKKYKANMDIISFSKLKQFCKENSSVSSFIVNLNVWKTLQVKNAREYRFMVGNEYYFSLRNSLIFSYILLALNIIARTNFALGIVAFIPVTLLVNIMLKLTKRSQFAEEAYKDVLNFKDGLLYLTDKATDEHRWDLYLIDSVAMECGVEVERIIRRKIQNNTLIEHYNSRLIDVYRRYPDFRFVSEFLPVFKSAQKKSFFIYTKRGNNL